MSSDSTLVSSSLKDSFVAASVWLVSAAAVSLELLLFSGSSGFGLALKKGEMGLSVPLAARSLNRARAELGLKEAVGSAEKK